MKNWNNDTSEEITKMLVNKQCSNNVLSDNIKNINNENKLWENMKDEINYTLTENGAVTLKSSKSNVLDLFSMGGSLRKRNTEEVQKLISLALNEDFLLGVKCLFYLGDIRGGQGERKTFREGLKVLSKYYPEETKKLMELIPEYNRWDSILYLENIDIKDFILDEINNSFVNGKPSLIFKWLPSENSSSLKTKALARKLRKYLGYTSKEYRMIITKGRKQLNLVETNLSNKDYSFDYSKLPGKAGIKYVKAFNRNDTERYSKYLKSVEKGESKINTKTLFPYEIVEKARNSNDKAYEVMWKNLPNYINENEKGIVVCDTSGSMSGQPINVAISLAMYMAERNKGQFANKFITFSSEPELQEIKGSTLQQKILNLNNAKWEGNTDLQAVFDLILDTAIKNKINQEELPNTIYIVSDMEFDSCTNGGDYYRKNNTNFKVIKEKYAKAGYEMPQLVFWNVDSRQNNVPVDKNENGVILVSGFSPTIFKMVCEVTTPEKFMLKVLNNERYNLIDKKLK